MSLQLAATQVGMAVGGAGLAALTGFPPGTLLLLFLTRALNAPAAISTSALLNHVAPKGALAESYTLVVTAGLVGSAAGNTAAVR